MPVLAGSATKSRESETACSTIRRGNGALRGRPASSPAHRSTYVGEQAQLRDRRDVQLRVQAGHDLARLEVPELGQPLGLEPFEQHRPAVRVGAQQPDRAAALPVLQREVLVLGLLVGEGDLEDGRPARRRTDRDDEGHEAVHHPAVGAQLPLLEETFDEGGQRVDPGGPVRAATGHAEDTVGQLHPGPRSVGYFLPFSAGPLVESAAMNASWGTSTRPTIFIRFLPSFCFSSSLRLRVMSPP